MICGNDDGCRHKHFPVAIEGQESKRSEHVEVGFDSASGEVDQHRAEERLGDGDYVTRRCPARLQRNQ